MVGLGRCFWGARLDIGWSWLQLVIGCFLFVANIAREWGWGVLMDYGDLIGRLAGFICRRFDSSASVLLFVVRRLEDSYRICVFY